MWCCRQALSLLGRQLPVLQSLGVFLAGLVRRLLLVCVVLFAVGPDKVWTFLGAELLVAQRLVLVAKAADLPADGVQLAVDRWMISWT